MRVWGIVGIGVLVAFAGVAALAWTHSAVAGEQFIKRAVWCAGTENCPNGMRNLTGDTSGVPPSREEVDRTIANLKRESASACTDETIKIWSADREPGGWFNLIATCDGPSRTFVFRSHGWAIIAGKDLATARLFGWRSYVRWAWCPKGRCPDRLVDLFDAEITGDLP